MTLSSPESSAAPFSRSLAPRTPLPDWLDRAAYPFEPRLFATPHGNLSYVDLGQGPTYLFVHGTPSWSFEWRAQIAALGQRARCVAPDHLGFGLSDKPKDAPYRPADHARRLTDLVRALDLRDLTLVVHDFGGPIGLGMFFEEPARVRRVVVLNTWAWAHAAKRRIRWMSRLIRSPFGRFLYRRLNASPRWLVPSSFADRRRLSPAIHGQYLAPFPTPASRIAPWVLGCELAGSDDYYESLWQRRELLAEQSLAIVWGMKDPAFRLDYLARWIESFPHARVVKCQGAGHFPQEEAPDEVLQALLQP